MRTAAALLASLLLFVPPAPTSAQSATVFERVGWHNNVFGDGIKIHRGYAYVGVAGGLRVVDVSDPSRPRPVGTVTIRPDYTARPLAVDGDKLYVNAGGLYVVDLADPTQPTVTAAADVGAFHALTIVGRYGYGTSPINSVHIVDLAGPTRVATLDLGNPGTGVTAVDLAVSGRYLYVAAHYGGLLVYDVSDPAAPRQVGSGPNSLTPGTIEVAGGYAYAVDTVRLSAFVLSLADPTAPREVGSLTPQTRDWALQVHDGRLYMFAAGLRVYSLADPAAPIELAHYSSESLLGAIALAGDLVYAHDRHRGLLVLRYPAAARPAERVRAYAPLLLQRTTWPGGPGTFTSSLTVQNAGSAEARVTLRFIDQAGTTRAVTTGTVAPGLSRLYHLPTHLSSLPPGPYAAAIVSDQPVLAIANVLGDAPPMAGSYTALPADDAAPTVWFPAVYRGYHGYGSTLTLVNAAAVAASATVTYRDPAGTVAATERVSLPANGSANLSQALTNGLPDGFIGSAIVDADGPLAGVAHVVHPNGEMAAHTGVTLPGAQIMPIAYKNYSPLGWTSSVIVQNLGDTAVEPWLIVDQSPSPTLGRIEPGASRQIYLGNVAAIRDGYAAPLWLQGGSRLTAVINTRSAAGHLSSQNVLPFDQAGPLLHLPALYSEYSPLRWASSFAVRTAIPAASGAAPIAISYASPNGFFRDDADEIPRDSTRLYYQPATGLPAEFHGSARISTSGGAQVHAVVNNLALGQGGGDWLMTYESYQPQP